MPLLPSLSSAPKIFLFATSETKGTAPRLPLLGTAVAELRGMLDDGWLERPPLPMTLTSVRDGDDLRPGKFPTSSSFVELVRFTGGEELMGPVLSKTPLTELEPGRTGEVFDALDKVCDGILIEIGVAGPTAGVDAVEPTPLLFAGGVLAATSELLSWEAVSSPCSWTEVTC